MRPLLLALTLGFGACAPREPATEEPGGGTRLVVLLVVDQLPSWAFDGRIRYLDGGLARLVREGVYYPQAVYPYAATFTAVGHAALVTGAPPARSGILANKWWDRAEGRSLEAVSYTHLTLPTN